MKILYFDTETTGLNPKVNEIIQFSAILEKNQKILGVINLMIQPTKLDAIDPEALKVIGKTVEELKSGVAPCVALHEIQEFLGSQVDKYDKKDKVYPAGHNVQFDLDFFQNFWKQHGDPYGIGSYINWRALDSRILANFLILKGKIKVPDVKLGTLCGYYNIPLDAHNSLNDIEANRLLIHKMLEEIS